MMRSLAARFLIRLYDAADTLYHHIVAIDNKKMKKMKKAKRFGFEDGRERKFNVQTSAVSVPEEHKKYLLKKKELKYTVNNISHITQNIEEFSFFIMISVLRFIL